MRHTYGDLVAINRETRKKLRKSEKELKRLRKVVKKMVEYKLGKYEDFSDGFTDMRHLAEKADKVIKAHKENI